MGTLLIEAGAVDAMREPQLLQIEGQPSRMEELLGEEGGFPAVVMLGCAEPCVFLELNLSSGEATCMIHPTRPNECVACPAGGSQCQMARQKLGMKPLLDSRGELPTLEFFQRTAHRL